MKISGDRLSARLDHALAPIYLVAGDEPLLVNEAADAIRDAARRQGYVERALHVAQRGFDWNVLGDGCDNLSLFAARRIVEVRLPSGKPGDAGARAMSEYAANPPPDVLLLVITPRLDRKAAASRWVKSLEKAGCLVDVRALTERQLPRWIDARMRSRGFAPTPEAVQFLAERVEGNLLAAVQEMDKLELLRGSGPVDVEGVREAVSDSARFDVFQLADAAVGGKPDRALRILDGLWAEGVAPPLILWALARELRVLNRLAWEMEHGKTLEAALAGARIWSQRKPLVTAALKRRSGDEWRGLLLRTAAVERVVKGVQRGNVRQQFTGLVADLAGVRGAGLKAAS